MKDSAKYAKIVELSEEDQKQVFEELCRIVEEAIALYHKDNKALPPPTSGRDFANKMQQVA